MKRNLMIFFLLLFFGQIKAQIQRAELQASGLTCSMCSNAIHKSLKTLAFVEKVDTDLEKNMFTIVFRPRAEIDFEQISRKVESAGFSVANFWVYTQINDKKPKENEVLSVGNTKFRFVQVKNDLNGREMKMKLVDKHFVSPKEYRKYETVLNKPGNEPAGKIYNVII